MSVVVTYMYTVWLEQRQENKKMAGNKKTKKDAMWITKVTCYCRNHILYATAADKNLQVRPWDSLRGPVVKGNFVTLGKRLMAMNLQTDVNDKRGEVSVVR